MEKHPIVLFALLALASTPAFAVLGKTAEECTKQYGRPVFAAWTSESPKPNPPARTRYDYRWRSFGITARFLGRDVADSRCASLSYRKSLTSPELTAAEIESILALNSGGSTWERAPGGWKRKDNRAFAMDLTSDHGNNVLVHELYVFAAGFDPERAAAIIAGSSAK